MAEPSCLKLIKSVSSDQFFLLKISNNQTPEIDIFANRSHANFIYNLLKDGSKNLDF